MSVRAAVLRAPGAAVEMADVELEAPHAGEVEVAIAAAGVCGSDVHVVTGDWDVPMPVVLGHEGSGVVTRLGEGVDDLAEGDHVVLSWVPQCGECRQCRAGRPWQCELVADVVAPGGVLHDGTSRWGGGLHHYLGVSSFAERVVVPRSGAVRIRDDAPLDLVAIVGCAVATGVGSVLNTAAVPEGATVAVIGCGGVGLSVVQGARLARASRIVACDINPAKLEVARRVGATETVDALPSGFDFVFDAIGKTETTEQAIAALGPGGAAVIVGLPPTGAPRASTRWCWPRRTSASSAPTTAPSTRSATSRGSSTATWTASWTSTASSPAAARSPRRPRRSKTSRRVGPCARCSSRHRRTGMSTAVDRQVGEPGEVRFKRVLGLPALVFFGLAYMVPLTVWTTYGIVTTSTEGHLPLAYVITTIAMLFTAYSYGRMVLAHPVAGSAYTYASRSFGRGLGFMVGWALLLDYIFLPMINYLVIGLYMQDYFPDTSQGLWVVIAVALVTGLNILGVRLLAGMNLLFVGVQFVFIAVFAVMAIVHISSDVDVQSWTAPFYDSDTNLGLVFAGAAILALSFLGFDAVSTLAEETEDPKRKIPLRSCCARWRAGRCTSSSPTSATSPSRTSRCSRTTRTWPAPTS